MGGSTMMANAGKDPLWQAITDGAPVAVLEDLRGQATPLVERFLSMYDPAAKSPELVASAQKEVR